jgi:hypothetical protein
VTFSESQLATRTTDGAAGLLFESTLALTPRFPLVTSSVAPFATPVRAAERGHLTGREKMGSHTADSSRVSLVEALDWLFDLKTHSHNPFGMLAAKTVLVSRGLSAVSLRRPSTHLRPSTRTSFRRMSTAASMKIEKR